MVLILIDFSGLSGKPYIPTRTLRRKNQNQVICEYRIGTRKQSRRGIRTTFSHFEDGEDVSGLKS